MESLFGIGPMELAFIFLLAFILLGPRDLPRLAYQLGRWARQAQLLYAEFRREWEAEVQEVAREVEQARHNAPRDLPPANRRHLSAASLLGDHPCGPLVLGAGEGR
jgi:Sec-independent protein translocase protein TatA